MRYESNIPRQVGMAGSSAIIVAALRCLMEFYSVEIPLRIQPSLVLSVEREELGITAGLQDRVIQVYEGMVYMDFSSERTEILDGLSCGYYEPLVIPPENRPLLYLAFKTDASEPTEIVHNDLRFRWEHGDTDVHAAMKQFALLAQQARDVIFHADWKQLGYLMDANFNLRRRICKIADKQLEMIETAREAAPGISAKFAGSGGAIIGLYPSDIAFQNLCAQLNKINCKVIKI